VKDTIPKVLKSRFFGKKEAPNMLDYDVIGFSVESCLTKYNIDSLSEVMVGELLTRLHKTKGYHERVKFFDFRSHMSLALNGGVWDITNGTILRLAEGKIVSHAVKGYKALTQGEIQKLYGNPPVFKHL
jgi:hypothetical protein